MADNSKELVDELQKIRQETSSLKGAVYDLDKEKDSDTNKTN